MRSLKVYSIILASVLFIFFGVLYWPLAEKYQDEKKDHLALKELEISDLHLALSYFKEGQYAYALDVVKKHQKSISIQSEIGREWLILLTKISEKTFDVPQLRMIYEYFPNSLDYHENASLLVAESFIMDGKNEAYQTLRDGWISREISREKWALLDADHLLLQGEYQKGSKLLEAKLTGKDETLRLIRLSLLHMMESPEKALSYLEEARENDPSDLDVFLYETKLLEKLGNSEKANEIYRISLKNNPQSVFMHDQFAYFLIRQGEVQEAIEMWKKALNIPSAKEDMLQADSWLALNFFDNVVNGKKHTVSPYAFSHTSVKPLITYFSDLDENVFVDEKAFAHLPMKEKYLEKEQTVYWFSLLDALSKNEQEKALNLILNSPFKEVSFNPNLEFAFLQALNIQKTGEKLHVKLVNGPKIEHPLLKSIIKNKFLEENEEALLRSEEAFAALSLAAGFTDAALKLHRLEVIPTNFPEWFTYEITKAMREKLGDEKALKFAANQVTEDLQFFHLMQEMNARVALNKGQKELAEKIYASLSDNSMEAKSYFARKAFKEHNFAIAEKLTEELLIAYPNDIRLLANLRKIRDKKG